MISFVVKICEIVPLFTILWFFESLKQLMFMIKILFILSSFIQEPFHRDCHIDCLIFISLILYYTFKICFIILHNINFKPFSVNAFKQEHKLKTFGMPVFLGSGSHEFKGEKYRFLVTEHFGSDLWKIFLENDEIFPRTTVFKLGIQIVCMTSSILFIDHQWNFLFIFFVI